MDEVKQHIDENAIAGYVDWVRKEGPRPEESILDHVASCSNCKSSILELTEMLDGVDQAGKHEKGRKIQLNLVLRAVAVLAGVLAVALIVQFLKPEKAELEVAKLNDDSVHIISPQVELENDTILLEDTSRAEVIEIIQHDTILFAANYTPNPGLEALVEARFRSVAKNGIEKDLIPETLRTGEKLTLDFSSIDGNEIEFIVVNNIGDDMKTILPQRSIVSIELNFDPGLYYWKIISSDEILLLGKFRLFNNKP
ncbi:MAG: hypothetical protein U9N86_15155 [Bacteroidota bacterium]|nr:hypothetical protein [Bacteroidota bacterium]